MDWMLHLRPACRVAFALALSVWAADAQTAWVTIAGFVSDTENFAIPNATVRATLRATNEVAEAHTDAAGHFSLSFLLPGEYRIDISARGFQRTRRTNLVMQASEALDLPIQLELAKVASKVSVSAETETIDTSLLRTQTMGDALLSNLPGAGRQAYNVVSLTPGALFTQEQFGSNGYSGLRSWDSNGRYVINGGREGTNQFLLNGAPISLTGRWQLSPAVDAVQQVRVLVNTYDAQYGRTGGGTVNTTLRSGSNQWHGGTFYFFHNSILDANATEKNQVGAPRGIHTTYQFGGVAGGPLKREKDFLFVSTEGYREVAPYPVVSDTPPLDLRDGRHFSNYGLRVYDPNSTRRCRDGIDTPTGETCFSTYIRTPFARNMIPASRVSPIGQKILALYPAPNSPGLTQNYVASANSGNYKYFQPIVRYDHNFNDRDRLYAVFTFQHGTDTVNQTGFPEPAALGSGTTQRTDQNYILEWTHLFSASRVWDLRASFGRFTEFLPQNTCSSTCITPDALGMVNMPRIPSIDQSLAPMVNLDQYSSVIGSTYSWNSENQIDLAPSLILMRGAHVLRMGGEMAYSMVGSAGPGRANGEFDFTHQWTQQYAFRSRGPLDGSGVADLLLGLPYKGAVDFNDSFYRTWPYFAGYVQDTWKVHPRVSVSLGLRYDVQVPFKERFNRFDSGFAYSQVNPYSTEVLANWAKLKRKYDADHPLYPYPRVPKALYGGVLFGGEQHSRPYKTDWTNLQPRVGVSWNFARNTVVRIGAGIFYKTPSDFGSTYGFSQTANYVSSLDGGLKPSGAVTGPYSLESPFPSGVTFPGRNLTSNIGQALAIDGRDRPVPRTYQYSIGLQRELPFQILLETSYSGSITVHDSLPVEIDSVSAQDFRKGQRDPFYLNRQLPDPFAGIIDPATELGSPTQIKAYDLLRPYPLFDGVTINTNAWARYRYDALQVQMEKRVLDSSSSGVLSLLVSYRFAKSFEASHRLNSWNLAEKPVHELSAIDKPQSLAFAGTWDLPFGWGRRFLPNVNRFGAALVNGWAVDWIATYYSGSPVNKPDATFTCGSYFAPGGQNAAHWFNNDPNCYQARGLYTLRNVEDRFSNIRTPAAPQVNLSVEKTFWLNDRWTLQFRGEAFNLTNTPIFGAPNTDYRDPRFGQLPVQQNNFPRYVQIAAKIIF